MSSLKSKRGQFYTINSEYILQNLFFDESIEDIIEPFAGQGDLIKWVLSKKNSIKIEAYDIEPKYENIIKRDTLQFPPSYKGKFILTNPPYLARNKSEDKSLFDMYNTNDLFKCFIHSFCNDEPCKGGILIIPASFFFSPRDIDYRCRDAFLSKYKILRINYFEEDVFPDTSTTVVAFSFIFSNESLLEQTIEWNRYPHNEKRNFKISKSTNWIVGGEIYALSPSVSGNKIRRYVENMQLKEGEYITSLTLCCLDSGKKDGMIHLDYKKGYIYNGKDTSRTYATICLLGKILTDEEQENLAFRFNAFLQAKRDELWSLFLPQFRESKEYARKRLPFDLAYTIILHLI